jgi:cold shock CspA family protein
MAKPKETFNKREKEKKRLKQRQDKKEKMEERKANAPKAKSLDDMMAYLDENGNLSSTPPDPKKAKVFKQEDMQIGVPKYEKVEADIIRNGTVTFFDESKGFGFINDKQTGERVFVHINQLTERISENDKVTFEVESGAKGLSAVNIKKVIA